MSTAAMQAAVLEQHEAPFRLSSIPCPVPGPDQALVRIAASAVNPLDIKIRAGDAAHSRHPLPAILGLDLAGTIDATGENVTASAVVMRFTERLGVSVASRVRSRNSRRSMPICSPLNRRMSRCVKRLRCRLYSSPRGRG